mmetsp:Transcript_11670/g.27600  ORF Transcript_11670/g.27600 Transcript_11670/m.27600 type:complete len:245 (+) Transcript_11670:916-1650(+)
MRLATKAPTRQSYQEDPVPAMMPAGMSVSPAPSEPLPTAATATLPASASQAFSAASATFPTAATALVPAIVSHLAAPSEIFPTAATTTVPATTSQMGAPLETLPTAAKSPIAVRNIAETTSRLSLALHVIQHQETLRARVWRRLQRRLHLLHRRVPRRVRRPCRVHRPRRRRLPLPHLRLQLWCRARIPKGPSRPRLAKWPPSLRRVLLLVSPPRVAKWQRHSKVPQHLRHFLPNLFVHNDFLC